MEILKWELDWPQCADWLTTAPLPMDMILALGNDMFRRTLINGREL